MKYKRRKNSDYSYYTEKAEKSEAPRRKKTFLFILLVPFALSLIAGYLPQRSGQVREAVSIVKTAGNDIISRISSKLSPLSYIGKKAATFCFEYIRGEEKEDEMVISTIDDKPKASSLKEVYENTDEPIEASAKPYIPNIPDTFSPSMPCNGEISSPFGKRVHPLTKEETSHNGIDIAVSEGTEIHAIDSGTIEKSEYNQFSGNFVVIKHQDGYTSSYAHLKEVRVKEGDSVQKGDVIGSSGSTGAVTGPHLHMEIRKDSEPVDPMNLIKVN